MKKLSNPWKNAEGYYCFACCPNNEYGLKMEFYEDGEDIVCIWKPDDHYQSWLNTLHGGIQSLMVDEICSWVIFRKLNTSGVTSRLEMKYLKNVSTLDNQITVRARLTKFVRNIAYMDAEIYNEAGEVCTKGSTIYFCAKPEDAKANGMEECVTLD